MHDTHTQHTHTQDIYIISMFKNLHHKWGWGEGIILESEFWGVRAESTFWQGLDLVEFGYIISDKHFSDNEGEGTKGRIRK